MARDEDDNFLGVSTLNLEGYTELETTEVVACHEGLALGSDLDLQMLRVASDCINAVRNIHSEGFRRYGPIILEIMSWTESFAIVEFVSFKKSGVC